MCIEYEWDEEKRLINVKKHHVDFVEMRDFNWESALVMSDDRFDYEGEERYIAVGLIGFSVYRLSFTYRDDSIRMISMRKATRQEVKNYVRQI